MPVAPLLPKHGHDLFLFPWNLGLFWRERFETLLDNTTWMLKCYLKEFQIEFITQTTRLLETRWLLILASSNLYTNLKKVEKGNYDLDRVSLVSKWFSFSINFLLSFKFNWEDRSNTLDFVWTYFSYTLKCWNCGLKQSAALHIFTLVTYDLLMQ